MNRSASTIACFFPVFVVVACDPARSPPVAPDAVSPVSEAPARVTLSTGAPAFTRTVAREPDGALDLQAGSQRLKFAKDAVVFVDDNPALPLSFASEIVDVSRVGNGWLFATADGLITKSDSYLGPLRVIGDTGRAFTPTWSTGRLAWVDDRGELSTTTGDGAPRGIPTGGYVLGAAFSDVDHGAVAFDGGGIARTIDGGQTWTRVPTGSGAASDIFTRSGMLIAVMADGTSMQITAGGSLAPVADGADPDRPHLPPDRVRWVLDRVKAHNALEPAGPTRPLDADEVKPNMIIETHPWGKNAVGGLAIADPKGPLRATFRLYRSRVGNAWERYANGPVSKASVAFSTDGEHVAWPGECAIAKAGSTEPDTFTMSFGPSEAICVLANVRDPGHTRKARPGAAKLLAMHGDRLLYISESGALEQLEADKNWVTELARPHTALPVVDAMEAPDRTLIVIYGDGKRIEAEIGPDGAKSLRPLPLPRGARKISFADAQHGLSVGENGSEIFRTVNGGAAWEQVPLPIHGDPSSIAIAGDPQCNDKGCVVGSMLAIRGWGTFAPATDWLLSANRALAQAPLPARTTIEGSALTCVPDPKPLDTPRALQPGHGRTTQLAATGAYASIESDTDASGRSTFRARWDGTDARGAFHGEMRDPALAKSGFTYVLRAATRDGLLFERCPEVAMGVGCENLWAENGGGLRELPFKSSISDFDAPMGRPLGAAPLADGGAMIVLTTRQYDDETHLSLGPTVDRVVRLAKDGSIASERTFVWKTNKTKKVSDAMTMWDAWARPRALGTFGGVHGLFVSDRENETSIRFYPLEKDIAAESIPAARINQTTIRACTSSPAPNAALFAVPAAERFSMMIDPGDRTPRGGARAIVEASNDRDACIRRIESFGAGGDSVQTRWTGDGLVIDARTSGAYEGTAFLGGQLLAVSCTGK